MVEKIGKVWFATNMNKVLDPNLHFAIKNAFNNLLKRFNLFLVSYLCLLTKSTKYDSNFNGKRLFFDEIVDVICFFSCFYILKSDVRA